MIPTSGDFDDSVISVCRSCYARCLLSTADKRDDLETIARAEDGFRVAGSWHDFEVYFDGDVGLGDVELTEERGDGRTIDYVARLAVDFNLHGYVMRFTRSGRREQRFAVLRYLCLLLFDLPDRLKCNYCGSRTKVVRNWMLSRNWITSTCGLPAACIVEFQGIV